MFNDKKKRIVITASIIILALLLRLYGINWDQNQHQHPDERFLTMVSNSITVPDSFINYLNPKTSTLNPYNKGNTFFVYGTFPLTLNKLFVVWLDADNYHDTAIFGRFLSAICDIGTLIMVMLIATLWYKKKIIHKNIVYLAGFSYAIFVLPIQQSHFFTVDSFTVFFSITSFYFALKGYYETSPKNIILSGISFGFSLGSKLSSALILPLIAGLIFAGWFRVKPRRAILLITSIFIFVFSAYLSLRIADPRLFASGNFFDPRPNKLFIDNIKQLDGLSDLGIYYPPGVQWINVTPIIFPLKNIIFFGMGIPAFIFLCIGLYTLLRKRKSELCLMGLWIIGFFIYQGVQTNPSIRYFYVLYPFFALLTGLGIYAVVNKLKCLHKKALLVISVALLLIWPIFFMNIYTKPHSRVMASKWIYENIPPGSVISGEYWDDALPLYLEGEDPYKYTIQQLPVFEVDTPEKWEKMNDMLEKTDYIIFASNRAYGSILSVPKEYPQMSAFYKDLFEGKLPYKKIKEITSYPGVNIGSFTFEIPDQWSEEAFTVYDHPKITIFEKIR